MEESTGLLAFELNRSHPLQTSGVPALYSQWLFEGKSRFANPERDAEFPDGMLSQWGELSVLLQQGQQALVKAIPVLFLHDPESPAL